jgi:RHS repeat-associated protein
LANCDGQTLTWNHENRHPEGTCSIVGGGYASESYLYDADGIRVKKTSNGLATYSPNQLFETTGEAVWVDDSLPSGAVAGGNYESWNWSSSPVYSGSNSHVSAIYGDWHQHYFYNATQTITPASGQGLYAYVYLDPANPPSQVMLQWAENGSWEHRAYWGADIIPWGVNGTESRRSMGPLPAAGGWVRLEVPAALVGLEGKVVHGMAFTLYGGRAWWDKAGVSNNSKYYLFNDQRIALRKNGVLTYLHSDHLGSTVLESNTGNTNTTDQKYYAYGRQRDSAPVTTDYRFTGQKEDASGLYYYNARYYDPAIGQFISPDTLVPDPTNLQDYNRYMYVRGNPLRYNDPSGHSGVDKAIHDSNGGPPLTEQQADNLLTTYYDLGVDWQDLPNAAHAALQDTTYQYATVYPDVHGNVVSQEGTFRDPAVMGASAFAGWRMGRVLLSALGYGCLDDGCDSELRTYESTVQGHHPWPQYLGGPRKQPLLDLPPDLHGKFHAGLDKIFARAKGKIDWNSLTKTEQDDILSSVLTYSQDFDADYGTKTFDAVLVVLKTLGMTPP